MDTDTGVEKLRSEVADLRSEVGQLTASIDDLVMAWKMAGKMVSFTKWAAGVATAFIGFWIAITKLRA